MATSPRKTKRKTNPAALAQINPSGLSDVPTDQDAIGFRPYVRAITWFLLSEKTKPPLSMSVEGPWGSGKTSFMLQLEKELKVQNPKKENQYYVRFNAWRSDKDEALWAAFALTFIKQLEPDIPLLKRVRAHVDLLWDRIEWRRGWFQLAQLVAFLVAFVALTIYAITHPQLLTKPSIDMVAVGIPWLGAAYLGLEKAKRIFGNPLSYDLSKYVRNLKYEDKVAFIDRFQDDFASIVRSYVGETGRVFIFIDDLDRCEVPRAAELLQAINLLLSADHGNLFFILGLDREMVAAGIAAKNEKILPYLAAGRVESTTEKPDFHRIGIDYGYSFMEKFIQVPFRVPRPDEREITRWVSELSDAVQVRPSRLKAPAKRADSIDIRAGSDPDEFDKVVEKMAQLFGFNPRRLKQFINVFRLRVMIALTTGILAPAQQGGDEAPLDDGISIQQLGLFTAVLMRWSELAGDLLEQPKLFDEICTPDGNTQGMNGVAVKWRKDAELRRAITLDNDPQYSLRKLDVKPLMMVMPDAYFGMLGERDPKQARTQLVAGLGAQQEGSVGLEVSSRPSRGTRRRSSRRPGPSTPGRRIVKK